MNKKIAFGFIVLTLVIGTFIGATIMPKIESSNGISETTTIFLRLNEKYKAKRRGLEEYFVYSGCANAGWDYHITVILDISAGYAGGLTSYPIYVRAGHEFYFDGKWFKVKELTNERIKLEIL